jgi:hypothetical protein
VSSINFQDRVSPIPTDWLQDVNTLTYNVFGGAQDASEVLIALGLGTLSSQDADAVAITGGTINSTAIGATTPAAGAFTQLRASAAPTVDNDVVNKHYLDLHFEALSGMSTMDPANVVFTGGEASDITITGSTINGTPIGASSRATGAFTTLSLTNALSVLNGGTGTTAFGSKYLTFVAAITGSSPVPAHFSSVPQIPAGDVSGLGDMALQEGSNVNITGGTLSGVTLDDTCELEGVGTLAAQNANAVAITGGTLTNVTIIGETRQLAVQQVIGATTLDGTKDLFVIDTTDGTFNVVLPDPSTIVKPLYLKNIGPARCSLTTNAGVTIDGQTAYTLWTQYESVTLISDGTKYHVF